jgi:Zn finger protein HypA/HybF involved in hydrogenase expression
MKTDWERFAEACWNCGRERPEGIEHPENTEYICPKCKEESNNALPNVQ